MFDLLHVMLCYRYITCYKAYYSVVLKSFPHLTIFVVLSVPLVVKVVSCARCPLVCCEARVKIWLVIKLLIVSVWPRWRAGCWRAEGGAGRQNRLGDGILEIMKIGCWSRPRHRTGGWPQFIAYNTTWTSPNYLQKREIWSKRGLCAWSVQ